MMISRKERVLRTLRFEPIDRTPIVGGFVRHPAFLADAAGVTVDQFWESPRRTAIAAFKTFGVDVILALILPDTDSATLSQVEHKKQEAFLTPEDVRDYVAIRYAG